MNKPAKKKQKKKPSISPERLDFMNYLPDIPELHGIAQDKPQEK